MRLRLVLAYLGTAYSGWQIQEKPCPPPTIQGRLEAALHRLTGRQIRIFGSGRTDAGVHAHAQVAHCDVPDTRAGQDWRRCLNALLPDDIRVLGAFPALPDFHARKDACCKTYVYQFWQEHAFIPPALTPFVWSCGPLDVAAMLAALPCLQGEHDFASLQNAGTDIDGTVRRISHLELETMPQQSFYPTHAPLLRLRVTANGFLKQMVRNIAGLVVACGRGKLDAGQIPTILAACDRRALPSPTAPPGGLTLAQVEYPTHRLAIPHDPV